MNNSGALRICCFPMSAKENKVIDILYKPLRDKGLILLNYNWFGSNFSKLDIFHVHWPDAVLMGNSRWRIYIKLALFLFSVGICSLRNKPIIYSVHNISSHEGNHPRLEKILWRFFIPRVSVFIHMNSNSIEEFRTRWHDAPGKDVVIRHPHYERNPVVVASKSEAKKRLGISGARFVILSFGLVRPYKGLEDLIATFKGWSRSDAQLIILGRPVSEDYGDQLTQAAKGDRRISLQFRYVPDDELETYLSASDLIAMTHKKLNNSGVAIMALSSGRPVLAPALGGMLDLESEVGRPWVILYRGEIARETLSMAYDTVSGLSNTAHPDLSKFDPRKIAFELEHVYRRSLSNKQAQDAGTQ